MKFFLVLLVMTLQNLCTHANAQEALLPYPDRPASPELLRTVEYVLNCYGTREETTQKLVPVAKIIESSCKIDKLGMFFDYFGTLNIPQARILIVQAVNDLLESINNNSKITPLLANSPFTRCNIIIRIRVRPLNCGFYYPPLGNVSFITFMDGQIIYDTLNSYTYEQNTLLVESIKTAEGFIPKKAED